MDGNITVINTDALKGINVGNDLYQNRTELTEQLQQTQCAPITVYIQAYNRLEKTKRCIESILKYTKDSDYELLLIDNGSTDGTLEYFKSVKHDKKRIIYITHNIGSLFPSLNLFANSFAKYICALGNDIIVTKNWLNNLLLCMESDPKNGAVLPVSNNVSNLQQVELKYNTPLEMQLEAEKYNHSSSTKWEERLRIITAIVLFRKEVLLGKGYPWGDCGFFHDFGDDDLSFAIRRLGYKLVLATDTWVCHDHDFRNLENKDPEEFQRSLNTGRQNFKNKYFGIDAWDDVNNYYLPYIENITLPVSNGTAPKILGLDVRCGTPILDFKNKYRKQGVFEATLSAFTRDPKYWLDLKTICYGDVICAGEDTFGTAFEPGSFDCAVCDNPINMYKDPQNILSNLFKYLKPGGVLACKLKNAYSFLEYLNMLGNRSFFGDPPVYNISPEAFMGMVNKYGGRLSVVFQDHQLAESQRNAIAALLPKDMPEAERNEVYSRLLADELLFIFKKHC